MFGTLDVCARGFLIGRRDRQGALENKIAILPLQSGSGSNSQRCFLYDQGEWSWTGAVDQSGDHRGAWRKALGYTERG